MIDDDKEPIDNQDPVESSADQDAWQSLSCAIRDQLGKMVPHMELNNFQDAHALVEAAWTAMCIHKNSLILDKWVELEKGRPTPD